MTKFFVTSDPHFWHRGMIRFQRYSFLSEEEFELLMNCKQVAIGDKHVRAMNDLLIENTNKIVGEDDVMFILGDFVVGVRRNEYTKYVYDVRSRIKCKRIYMIFGNHDHPSLLAPYFTKCFVRPVLALHKDTSEFYIGDYGEAVEHTRRRRDEFMGFSLDHYAPAIWRNNHRGYYGLYGHSHQNAETFLDTALPNRRSIDCGFDNAYKIFGEYRPFNIKEEIVPMLQSKAGTAVDHHSRR